MYRVYEKRRDRCDTETQMFDGVNYGANYADLQNQNGANTSKTPKFVESTVMERHAVKER